MVDLLKSLSRWPVTGKRGRKGTVSTEFRPGLDKRIQEGVANLTRNILGRRADDRSGNQDFDNLVILSNNQMDNGKSAGRKFHGAGIKRHDSVRMVQDTSRKRRRKIESIDIDGSRIVKQTEAKCNYCDRTFKSFQAMGGHKRIHHYIPEEKRERMEESAGTEKKPEGENDADIKGSKIKVARMEWTSDKHDKKDGRISGSDDINELDLNKSPKFVSDRQNGAKRAPDATTAGKGRKKQQRRMFDLNRSPNSPH